MKKLFVLIMILSLSFFSGCSDSSTNPEDVQSHILIPLKVGNYWDYESITYDSIGTPTYSKFISRDSVYVDTLINNEDWYFLSNSEVSAVGQYYRNQEGYGYGILSQGDSTDQFKLSLVFKYPAKIGETSDFNVVIETNVEIVTKAGTFNCIQYRRFLGIGDGPIYWDQYVAPNIGVIRTEGHDNNKLFQRLQLVDFRIE